MNKTRIILLGIGIVSAITFLLDTFGFVDVGQVRYILLFIPGAIGVWLAVMNIIKQNKEKE